MLISCHDVTVQIGPPHKTSRTRWASALACYAAKNVAFTCELCNYLEAVYVFLTSNDVTVRISTPLAHPFTTCQGFVPFVSDSRLIIKASGSGVILASLILGTHRSYNKSLAPHSCGSWLPTRSATRGRHRQCLKCSSAARISVTAVVPCCLRFECRRNIDTSAALCQHTRGVLCGCVPFTFFTP